VPSSFTFPRAVEGAVGPADDRRIRALCVFSGSRIGVDVRFRAAAERLGGLMAARGIRLIYGGGAIGLMGVVARTALAAGGEVVGVIPDFLMALEVGDPGVTELIVVKSMHERKARMFELADAFVVLPGGLGTLDETIEMATWKQLQLHRKPIVAVNLEGYWDPFFRLLDNVVAGGFAHPAMTQLVTVVSSVDEVFGAVANAPVPTRDVLLSHLQGD